jgi:hypothetical protein
MKGDRNYKILCLGNSLQRKEDVIQYLNKLENLEVQDYDIDNDEPEYLLSQLLNMSRFVSDGINLIIVFFPLTDNRANVKYIQQVVRLLGRNYQNNLCAALTNYKLIIEEYREEIANSYLKQLPEVLIKNVIILKEENILLFDDTGFKLKFEEILRNVKPFIPSALSFLNKEACKKIDMKEMLINTINKHEEFSHFLKSYPKVIIYLNMQIKSKKKDNYMYYKDILKYAILSFTFLLMFKYFSVGTFIKKMINFIFKK